MFRQKPELTWRHITAIEQAVRGAKPSMAHRLIAALEREHEVVVLTQNVDGLHRIAGSTRVIDIHGDCRELMCTRCEYRESRQDYAGLVIPPLCPQCGALVRPDVVLFEEALPQDRLSWLMRELARGFDAYFSIGTSSLFAYIARPIELAAHSGALTVEINPGHTPVSDIVDVKLACGAGRGLHAIFPNLQ
jgi:NAD-dependent deacetylase